MWKVYCDDNLIYSTKLETLNIYNAKLELELNKTGAFEFVVYPSHPHYSKMEKLKSIIKVYQNNHLIFKGRILNDTALFHNQKEIVCEGELSFLIDSIQRPYDFQSGENHTTIDDFFKFLIGNHNSQVDESRQFKVGNITVKDPNNYIVRADSTYLNTWETINKKLIETNGGYLWVRHEEDGNYIDYLEDFNTLSNQTIEFGKNLLDFNKIAKGEEIATAIIPLGAKAEGTDDYLTIKDVNGVDYVYNEEAVHKYGWIFKTVEWQDVTEASNLLTKAREYLADTINLVVTLELSAVDLAGLNKDFNAFRMGTYVSVKSSPHGVNSNFLVNKLSIELLNPKNNKLVLGKSYSTFTEKTQSSNSTQKEIINTLNGMQLQQGVTTAELNKAIQEVTEQNSSSISQSADEILLKVSEDYYLKEEANTLVESINTEFAQTNEAFEMRFSEFNLNVNDLANNTEAQFQEINKYIRFIGGNIILGEEGNEVTLKIENDRISFLQNGAEVAYFSDRKLYVVNGEFLGSLKLGNYAFEPQDDGSLAFGKVE